MQDGLVENYTAVLVDPLSHAGSDREVYQW